MTERIPLDDLTSDQLDQLHDDLDRYEEVVGELNAANTGLARQAGRAEAAITQVRALAARIRQGVPWTANDDDIAAHILRALDGDQAPAATLNSAAVNASRVEPDPSVAS